MSHLYSITNQGECQELECSDTIEAFARHKAFRASYEALVKPTMNERQAAAWQDCASEVWVRPDGKVSATISCHNRFCAVCSWRAARKKYAYTMRTMEQLECQKLNFLFLTLTVENVPAEKLKQELNKLMQSINRMQSTKVWKKRVLGYIRSLEITYNANPEEKAYDTYHPHLHYILAVPPDYYTNTELYMLTGKWRELWERSARLEYAAQISLDAIKGESIKGAVCEVSKYALKLSSVVELGLFEPVSVISDAVRGRRLVAYGGIFKELQQQLKEADKAERIINREVEGYVFKEVNGAYELQSDKPQRRERAFPKWVIEAVQALSERYKEKNEKELEALAVSLLDSPANAATPTAIVHLIKERAAAQAYSRKAANS